MKKNLKTCVERQLIDESTCLRDRSNPQTAESGEPAQKNPQYQRSKLKGAAVFSKTGTYAIVGCHRIPIATEKDRQVKPFERDGILWLPMNPIAAVFGHRAVADDQAKTLRFIYRRKQYVFDTEARYLVDGIAEPMRVAPQVLEGTLFFPVDFIMGFFRWRQIFTDQTGLIILSNRKEIFNRATDAPLLWELCAKLTLQQPNGREILEDVRRKTPSASRGRLLLTHDDWMELRRRCKSDDFCKTLLKKLKKQFGKSSEIFAEEPILESPAPIAKERAKQYQLAAERLISFGTLYRLTGERIYADRVAVEGEALASLASWDAETNLAFAATAAFGMAIGYDWCHSVWSEACNMKIERAMLRFAVRPCLDAYGGKTDAWRLNGAESTQIHVGMIAAALVFADTYPETSCRLLDRAPATLATCFAAYSPDGGYAEGGRDWEASTRALVLTLAMFESSCGSTYGFDFLPGFRATALFGMIAATKHGLWNPNGESFFAQTSFLPWFTRHYGNRTPAQFRRKELCAGEKRKDVFDLIFATTVEKNGETELPLDAVYRNAKLAIFRSDWSERGIFLSLHGGNKEIGAGVFQLESEGELFFSGRNTIAVDSGENALPDGKDGTCASLLDARSSQDRAYAVLDLSQTHPCILRGKRGIMLDEGRKTAVVQDELTLTEPATVVWTAYTSAKIEVLHTRYVILEQNGKRLLCRFAGVAGKWEAEYEKETNLTRMTVRVPISGKIKIAVACKQYCEGDDPNQPFYSVCPIGKWKENDRG